jgi:hypothetical protein
MKEEVNDIRNMNDLREAGIDVLQKLRRKEIDVAEAVAAEKVIGQIISSVKSQMEYGKYLDEIPEIDFMQDAHRPQSKNYIEGERSARELPHKKQ